MNCNPALLSNAQRWRTGLRGGWSILALAAALTVALLAGGVATAEASSAKPKRLLPLDNDFVQPPALKPSPLRPERRSAFSGAGFNVMDPGGSYLYRNQRSYTVRLVTNGQGNVETMRAAAQTAAAQVASASGATVTVAAGTVADTTPDLEPLHGEILLSIDASSPCTGSWAGCGGPRVADQHNADLSAIIRSGRIWIHPAAIGYTAAEKDHVVAHELGHALGLHHFPSAAPGVCPTTGDGYLGQRQVMHPCSYDASTYRAGDRNGFDHLLVKPLGSFGSPQASKSWALQDPDTYSRWVYYRGTDGLLRETRYTGTAWTTSVVGAAMAAGTTASGVADPTTGKRAVFYQGSDGNLWWSHHANGSWTSAALGGPMAAGTSPSAIGNASTGVISVFYQHSSGQLYTTYNPLGTGWGGAALGGAMAPGTSPSAIGDPASGLMAVYYNHSSGQLYTTYYPGTGWAGAALGGAMAPGTSPSAVGNLSTGIVAVYYQHSSGQLYTTYNPAGVGWANAALGGAMAPGTSPSAIGDPSANRLAVYYHGSNGQLWTTFYPGTGWGGAMLGGALAAGTSPSAVGNAATGIAAVFYKESTTGQLWTTYNPGGGWAGLNLGAPMG